MTLLGPDEFDKPKLHAEINQLNNQRFVCSLSAITAFGVITGWMISSDGAVKSLTFIVSILQMLVLFAIFWLSHALYGKLRTITAYFEEREASNWEQDWKTFTDESPRYWSYKKPQASMFIFLGAVSALFPFILCMIRGVESSPELWFARALTFAIGVAYMVFTIGMGFCGLFDREADAKKNWRKLNR